MSEHAILAILFGLTIREYKKEPWLPLVLVAAATYAAMDELHQLFISGRSGQLKDVLIDAAGGALGLGLLVLILYLKRAQKMKETEKFPWNVQGLLISVGI